jgi:hypothetical protein
MKLTRTLVLCAALLPAPALAAASDEDGWDAFGHALTLVQRFVRLAAQSDNPQAGLKGIDDVLSGRDPEANEALAGLLKEATADMPVEHRTRFMSIGRDLASLARKQIALAPTGSTMNRDSVGSALQARKDLNAMGLRYHDGKDFLDAVKRDDVLAVELFIAGMGVNLDTRDWQGRNALDIAKANGNARMAELLARSLPARR